MTEFEDRQCPEPIWIYFEGSTLGFMASPARRWSTGLLEI